MPPPKRKDNLGSSKTKEAVNGGHWRSEIENLTLIEERWTCVIGMMVETRLEHASFLELFNEAAEDQTREAVFALSYAKLIRGTKLLAKSDPGQGICHFASKLIEDGGEESMDPWLVCRLIKFFVNREKIKSFEILRSRVRAEEDFKAASTDKRNTKLRKRGEEWRDRVRVDDAPIDGPDLYVVLSGFHDPILPGELLKAGLPLAAVFKVLRPGEDVEIDHPRARDFWSSFEATLGDREAGRVICQAFCPPEISDSRLEGDVEALKSDAYRRISFLMYDLADITRSRASYIRKMEIQPNLDQVRPKFQLTETYDAIMSRVPEECASVTIVLDALLTQVEGLKVDIDPEEKYEAFGDELPSEVNYLCEKFDPLDVSSPEIVDPRFIVHGDDLGRMNRHWSWGNSIPEDFGVRVLRRSAIFLLWSKVPALTREQNAMHAYHVELISECFDAKVDAPTTSHYLHLLLFDKMVNGEVPRSNLRERRDLEKIVSFPSLDVIEKLTKTETILCDLSAAENSPSTFYSDSAIDYGKEISETFECPELFRLVNTRDMLGFNRTASPPSSSYPNSGKLDLEDFDSVQLLSADVFSQVYFNCSQKFESVETRYFPPTDSILVVFYNDRSKDDISEHRYAASIRTPVCLRDFSRFVIEEEKDWLEKEEETHAKKLREEAALRMANAETSGDYSLPSGFYTDADFVLPHSIKGSDIRKQKSQQSLINRTEPSQLSRDKLPAQVEGTRKGKRGKETKSTKGKIAERLEAIHSSSIPPIEDQEPSVFLGYDVADHRVQVSGSTSEFRSEDGTVVKVNLEEWTYGETRLRIIVELLGNDLVVHNVDDDATFRFTTANGISMGFPGNPMSKKKDSITEKSKTPKRSWATEMAVDPGFIVSWASGLVVETLPGDGPSDPFNIRQTYLSKGPECTGVSREWQRVYLRDGTMIVFGNDDSVLLLRPNARVVNCSGFSNPEGNRSLTVLEPDGKRYEILNGEIIRELGQELVTTSSDYEVGENFTRRSDGTNILADSEGYLAVSFPDGSRITTGYVINEHPVFCEWTEEEIRRFYPARNETENIIRDDGFVSVLLTCCMEHKNYATVVYDRSKNDCTLSMPGDVGVHISDTIFTVNVGTATSLKVTKDDIVFSGRTGKSPEGSSSSVFSLGRSSRPSVLDTPFLRTTDSFGDVFTVDLNGKTSYKKSRRRSDLARSRSKGYRLFAVKRDLSAYEHLHRSDREAQENEETAITFYRQVPRQTNQRLCTTLTALDPVTASQAWLQPYRVPSIRPTNEDRKDLLRSTYSVPWNYLIPYGKNGVGIRDRTWNMQLDENGADHSLPKVLLARTTQTIKNVEDNAIKSLQTALGRYWKKAMNNFGKYRSSVTTETAATFEEREFDDWLRNFALGRMKTLDGGSFGERANSRSKSQISRIEVSESRDRVAAEEIEWYKSCLRDRRVVPYFRNVTGACFLWVLECVNEIGGADDENGEAGEEN